MGRRSILALWVVVAYGLSGLFTAEAYKVDTHVWVAQQVLNDAQDGVLTFALDGQSVDVAIDPVLAQALRDYPADYRMGHIGPDTFPDMLTGQMVVHPGIQGGWKTDDWLQFLLQSAKGQKRSPRDLAFAYGYIGHAAGDIFAHTYVNQYAGDIFILTDGEVEVEKRHFALEKFIAHHTPALRDAAGNYIGLPHEAIYAGAPRSQPAVPAEFLRDALILNADVAEQNRKGGMLHLSLVYELRDSLDRKFPMLDAIDIWITQQIVQYYTGIQLNDEQAAAVFDAANSLHQAVTDHGSYRIDAYQSLKDEFTRQAIDGIDAQAEVAQTLNSSLSEFLDAKRQADEWGDKVAHLAWELGSIPHYIRTEICEDTCPSGCGNWYNPCPSWCKVECRIHEEVNEEYLKKEEEYNEALRWKAEADERFAEVVTRTQGVIHDAIDTLRDVTIEIIQAENEWSRGVIDSMQRLAATDLNQLRAHIIQWVRDIDDGMAAYIVANADVIRETMREGEAESPFDQDWTPRVLRPLQEWKDCWGYAVAGVLLAPANNALCEVVEHWRRIEERMAQFEYEMAQISEITQEWYEFKQRMVDEAKGLGEDLAYQIAEEVLGIDFKEIVDLFREPVDAPTLNGLFSQDTTNKGLLIVGDAAERVLAEMYLVDQPAIGGLPAQRVFDPNRYAVAYNAVVLAKLSLLNANQLNELARAANVAGPSIYQGGAPLYDPAAPLSNILLNAVRSIDGNHQWMPLAPPYPRRRPEFVDKHWPDQRQYGRPFHGENGFRLWQDPDARSRLFARLFKGPLVPGIDTPSVIGFESVLPPGYPYVVTPEAPYPFAFNLVVVDAGQDVTAREADMVQLNGSSALVSANKQWSQLDGKHAPLSDAGVLNPTFMVPPVSRDSVLQFQLSVFGNDEMVGSDTVRINVLNGVLPNVLPTANAGADFSASEGSTVSLNGSTSTDLDGDLTRYRWRQVSGPPVDLRQGDQQIASAVLPPVSRDVIVSFELEVTDDGPTVLETDRDTVQVAIQNGAIPPLSPTANAGPDMSRGQGAQIILSGARSVDPDGAIVRHSWRQVGGTVVALQGADTVSASFVPPRVSADESLEFELVVVDDDNMTASDRVVVTVGPHLDYTVIVPIIELILN